MVVAAVDMAAYLFSHITLLFPKFQINFVDYHNIAQAFSLDQHFSILLNHKRRVTSSRDLDLWYSPSSAKVTVIIVTLPLKWSTAVLSELSLTSTLGDLYC